MPVIIPIWIVINGEDDRGCGGHPAYFCSSKASADVLARGTGYYGGTAPVQAAKAMILENNDAYLLANDGNKIDLDGALTERRTKLKKQALAKLSEAELDALGIEVPLRDYLC